MTKYTLVTGGAGYIGSHFVDLFLQKYNNVIILDNLDHGYRDAVSQIKKRHKTKKIIFKVIDLQDAKSLNRVFARYAIETVIHFAGLCIVGQSVEDPGRYFANNISGSINLLNSMSKYKVKNFVFSSSCAVYGNAQTVPVNEQHELNPNNPYGLTKYVVEKLLPWYELRFGLKYIALRYFNVCGASPEGHIGFCSRFKQNKLVQDAVQAAVGLYPLHLTYLPVKTPDKSPIRDYVDVMDLADAHLKAIKYLRDNSTSQVINLGTGKGYSVKQIISKVEDVLKVKIKPIIGVGRKGEAAMVYAANNKAKRLLNWQPTTPLSASIVNLAKWYTSHPKGYSK